MNKGDSSHNNASAESFNLVARLQPCWISSYILQTSMHLFSRSISGCLLLSLWRRCEVTELGSVTDASIIDTIWVWGGGEAQRENRKNKNIVKIIKFVHANRQLGYIPLGTH